ncbi:MAG: DUF4388 domain-containing protein [Ardenticatenia bacterium]|nr:DUF4388 domain-containing protein [Ardenticatenia bacterium]
MALKGRLRDISLTQLLNLVKLARKTGALTIEGDQGRVELYFKEGKIVHASLNGDGDLARLLLKFGRVREHQLRTVLQQLSAPNDRELGLRLINAGYISRNDILYAIRRHTSDVVLKALSWEDGKFHFEPNKPPPPERIVVPINLDSIVLEGDQRQKELATLREELPDLNVALRFTENPSTNLSKIKLSRDEWRVISFINPRNTIAQIAKYSGLDEFQIRRIVLKLMRNGLVEVVGQPTGRPRPAQAAPQGVGAGAPSSALSSGGAPSSHRPKAPAVEKNVVRRLIKFIRGL